MKQNLKDIPVVRGHNNSVLKKVLIASGAETGSVATYNYAWLEKGMEVEKHAHPDGREYYHFLSGVGEMLLGKKWIPVVSGDMLVVQPGVIHSVKNHEIEHLVFTTLRTKDLSA